MPGIFHSETTFTSVLDVLTMTLRIVTMAQRWQAGRLTSQSAVAEEWFACRRRVPQYPLWLRDAPQIWGVGEAIGCVSPLVGDGIVTSMKSVQILLNNWDDPEGYTGEILREFSWLDRERKVVDKLANGRPLNLLDARVLLENSRRRMDMRMGFLDVFKMARSFK